MVNLAKVAQTESAAPESLSSVAPRDASFQASPPWFLRYGAAVMLVLAALTLALLLRRFELRESFFLMAIAVAVWYGGMGAGLVAIVLSILGLDYFFIPPIYHIEADLTHVPYFVVFTGFAFVISWFSASRRRAEAWLRQARNELENRVSERTAELRRTTVEALAAQRKYGDLVDAVEGIVWEADASTFQFLFVSKQAERILGYPVEQWLSQPTFWKDHLHPEDREWAAAYCAKATAEYRNHDLEYRFLSADGSTVWLRDLVTVLVENGRATRLRGIMFDITSRKKAESALREQASLLNLTHDTIFVRDVDNVITFWNRGAEELYGWKAEQAVGQTTHQLLRTFFPVPVEQITDELRRSGRWEGELVHTRADGNRVVVASRWALLRDEQDQPIAILETNNDITERKRAEEDLRLQANLLEQTHDAVLVWELGGLIIYWNRAAAQLYGFSKKEAMGRRSHDLLRTEHPMPIESFEVLIEKYGTWAGELTHTTRDGRRILVESRHVLMRDAGGRKLVLETNRDITERKHAEQGLRESEQRYRYIFESNRVSIWEEDFTEVHAAIQELKANGALDFRQYLATHPDFVDKAIAMVKIVDVNQATVELFGAQNRIELLVSLDRIFTPETRDVFAGELVALAEGRTWFESQTSLRTLRGDPIPVIFTIAFPSDPAKLNSVLVSIMDISKQQRAEEALRQAQTDLAHVSRMTTMGELTASLAHEINQPIAAVLTNANTCLRWLNRPQPDLEEARLAASRIVKDVTRASDIISSTRSLFKKAPAQREPVNVNDLIREMILLLHNEASRSWISIRVDLDERVPTIIGDRVQLQQVLMNLVLNGIDAVKAMDAPGEISVVSKPGSDGQLQISVSDTGVGLPKDKRDEIFNAFFTTKSQGTGLGLTISRSIVESHGGRLWASANAGRGTTFHLTLPAKGGA